jgi:hypothetical protein
MKATTDIGYIQLNGEDGTGLTVLFSDVESGISARIIFADGSGKGREVELDQPEIEALRDVLATDIRTTRKDGAFLKLESDDLTFTVRDTNRGEPYRDGFDFNLEREWEGYPIFIELEDCRDLVRAVDSALAKGAAHARSR